MNVNESVKANVNASASMNVRVNANRSSSTNRNESENESENENEKVSKSENVSESENENGHDDGDVSNDIFFIQHGIYDHLCLVCHFKKRWQLSLLISMKNRIHFVGRDAQSPRKRGHEIGFTEVVESLLIGFKDRTRENVKSVLLCDEIF